MYTVVTLTYFIKLSICKTGNSVSLSNCFDNSAILLVYKLPFNIFTPLYCENVAMLFSSKLWIGRGEAGQLQMDQSAAVYFLKFGFCFQCISVCSRMSLFRYCFRHFGTV